MFLSSSITASLPPLRRSSRHAPHCHARIRYRWGQALRTGMQAELDAAIALIVQDRQRRRGGIWTHVQQAVTVPASVASIPTHAIRPRRRGAGAAPPLSPSCTRRRTTLCCRTSRTLPHSHCSGAGCWRSGTAAACDGRLMCRAGCPSATRRSTPAGRAPRRRRSTSRRPCRQKSSLHSFRPSTRRCRRRTARNTCWCGHVAAAMFTQPRQTRMRQSLVDAAEALTETRAAVDTTATDSAELTAVHDADLQHPAHVRQKSQESFAAAQSGLVQCLSTVDALVQPKCPPASRTTGSRRADVTRWWPRYWRCLARWRP